jgi:hypothetical protein
MKISELQNKSHGQVMDIVADWVVSSAGDCGMKSFAVLNKGDELELVPLALIDTDKVHPLFDFKYTSKGMKYSQWDAIAREFERIQRG